MGLAIDAAVHLDLAPRQPPVPPGGTLGQIQLFYAEGVLAIAAALLVLLTGRRVGFVVAGLVAASALGAVLLYRFIDVGALGPLPDMYEPFWSTSKMVSAVAEAVAASAAAGGLLFSPSSRR